MLFGIDGRDSKFFIANKRIPRACAGKEDEVLFTDKYTFNGIPVKLETRCHNGMVVSKSINSDDTYKIVKEFSFASSSVKMRSVSNNNIEIEISAIGFNEAFTQMR